MKELTKAKIGLAICLTLSAASFLGIVHWSYRGTEEVRARRLVHQPAEKRRKEFGSEILVEPPRRDNKMPGTPVVFDF